MPFPFATYTKDQDAFAGLFSNAAEASLSLNNLSPQGALASAVANLLVSDPITGSVPAGNIESGTFGANVPDTGTYSFPSALVVTTSLTVTTNYISVAGKALYGTTPGTTGAINVDGATYSGIVAVFTNSTATSRITQATNLLRIGPTSNHALYLASNNVDQWAVDGSVASTSILKSLQAAGQVWGGPTSMTFYQSNGTTVAYQYLANGGVGIGGAADANAALALKMTFTASSGSSLVGLYAYPTIVALANSNSLFTARIDPGFTPGAFTGLNAIGLSITAFSVAGFTTPGNPVGIQVGVITGTGASVATALQLAPPAGATTNYLIAHTTAATFNVTAAGLVTAGTYNAQTISVAASFTGTIAAVSGITAGSATAITAGGSLLGLMVSSTASFGFFVGSGAPTIAAAKGSYYARSDGSSTSTRGYIATDSVGGWTNVVTAV